MHGHIEGKPILEVRDLTVEYDTGGDRPVVAVDSVDLDVHAGEFVGVVGESGCGKSTLLFAIAQLLSPPAAITSGDVRFQGQNLVAMSEKKLAALRWRDFSVVMQSAMNALNPVITIAAQFRDAIEAHSRSWRTTNRWPTIARPRYCDWSASIRSTSRAIRTSSAVGCGNGP